MKTKKDDGAAGSSIKIVDYTLSTILPVSPLVDLSVAVGGRPDLLNGLLA